MDHSVNSCGGKASSSSSSYSYAANKDTIRCDNDDDEEESGWTSYFEDFSKRRDEPSNHHHYCSSLDGGGSSLLSDAASYAAWKFSHHHNNNNNSNNNNHNQNHAVISSSRAAHNLPKKLCFNKAFRAKQISEDDPLEDTASSPVNSPKIRDSSPRDEIISSKIDGHQLDGFMGKGSTSSEHNNNSDLQIEEEEHGLNFNGKSIECTELKKRGLCLVPLSMLVNYLE